MEQEAAGSRSVRGMRREGSEVALQVVQSAPLLPSQVLLGAVWMPLLTRVR